MGWGQKEGVWGGAPEGMESCFSNTLLTAGVLERWDGLNSPEEREESPFCTDWGWGHLFLEEQVWRWGLHLQQIPAASPETTARSCLGL